LPQGKELHRHNGIVRQLISSQQSELQSPPNEITGWPLGGDTVKYCRAMVTMAVLAIFPAVALAQSNSENISQPFDSAAITKRVAPPVVLIRGNSDNGEILGTGFIISSDGKIATNLHVVQSLRSGGVQLASGDKYDSFSILTFDPRKDIAIIKIAGFDLPT
jgi:S1-C subfamily serine protease